MSLALGERLFTRGNTANGFYPVLDGAIEISAVDEEGELAILTIVEPSVWFGESGSSMTMPRTHDAIAFRTVGSCTSRSTVDDLLDREPTLWRELARLVAEELRLTFEVTESSALLSATSRLAARLLMIAEGYGGAAAQQHHIQLSRDQLSSVLSLSRQTVNKILKGL